MHDFGVLIQKKSPTVSVHINFTLKWVQNTFSKRSDFTISRSLLSL